MYKSTNFQHVTYKFSGAVQLFTQWLNENPDVEVIHTWAGENTIYVIYKENA